MPQQAHLAPISADHLMLMVARHAPKRSFDDHADGGFFMRNCGGSSDSSKGGRVVREGLAGAAPGAGLGAAGGTDGAYMF